MAVVLMINLLSACSSVREAAEEKRAEFLERDGLAFEVRLTCDLGDAVSVYDMEIRPGEEYLLKVLSTGALQGLTATVSGDGLKLEYQDVMFACEQPEDMVYAPVMVLPAAWAALKDGVIVGAERIEEGTAVTLRRFEGEEEYLFTFVFGAESTPLRRVTCEKNGKMLAECEILRTLQA